jgi:hypothetical protein
LPVADRSIRAVPKKKKTPLNTKPLYKSPPPLGWSSGFSLPLPN